ncbi:MAG: AhpC/TSA family protein [Bacteroidaceae bacterium]|nr:AhpC/TSA family protein [Bacteroidaceae bacterium]
MNKKTIITALLALVWVTGQAQERVMAFEPVDSVDFTIEGTVTESADSVSLSVIDYHPDWQKSFPVKNGHFSIKARLPEYAYVSLKDMPKTTSSISFMIDESPINVNLPNGTVTGSELNNKLNQYEHLQWVLDKENVAVGKRLSSEQRDSIMALFNHQIDVPETGMVKEAWLKYQEIRKSEKENLQRAIYDNLDNMIPAFYLFTNYMDFNYEELCELMREDRPYANHYKMENAWNFFLDLKLHHEDMKFNDCEVVDAEGTVHRLSEFVGKGNYVLVDFWASWCAPCIASMPKMEELIQKFEPQGLMMFGVSIDENEGAWKAACERLGYSWLKFRSNQTKGKLSVKEAFGVNAVPLSVLIAPDGTIIAQNLGTWDWDKKLAEIFSE